MRGESIVVAKCSQAIDGNGCNCLNRNNWALNSAVECHLHTVEVIGSNPIAPTTELAAALGLLPSTFPA